MNDTHFYNTIYNLRSNGEITLFDRMLPFTPEDEKLVTELLQFEYATEADNYPFTPPDFNAEAALWGAKTIYTICQLILYRENKIAELPQLLPPYRNVADSSAMLSADLCLRFLPQVLHDTKHIDPEDALIEMAEAILRTWHYSGIGFELPNEQLGFDEVFANPCLAQLYTDRVIEKKDQQRAAQPLLNEKIRASMGMHAQQFWKTFNY